jgi:hypothetical protein
VAREIVKGRKKGKKKKNGLAGTYCDSVFDTLGTIKNISIRRF